MTNSPDMVRRVGNAITVAFSQLGNNFHPYETSFSWEAADLLARAAIGAMREPTPAIAAAWKALDPIQYDFGTFDKGHSAMIDATLPTPKEETP